MLRFCQRLLQLFQSLCMAQAWWWSSIRSSVQVWMMEVGRVPPGGSGRGHNMYRVQACGGPASCWMSRALMKFRSKTVQKNENESKSSTHSSSARSKQLEHRAMSRAQSPVVEHSVDEHGLAQRPSLRGRKEDAQDPAGLRPLRQGRRRITRSQ